MFAALLLTVALALHATSSPVIPRQDPTPASASVDDTQIISADPGPTCEARCQNGLNILSTCSQTDTPTETADLDCICSPDNIPVINDCFLCISETGESSETVNVLAGITPICQARTLEPPV